MKITKRDQVGTPPPPGRIHRRGGVQGGMRRPALCSAGERPSRTVLVCARRQPPPSPPPPPPSSLPLILPLSAGSGRGDSRPRCSVARFSFGGGGGGGFPGADRRHTRHPRHPHLPRGCQPPTPPSRRAVPIGRRKLEAPPGTLQTRPRASAPHSARHRRFTYRHLREFYRDPFTRNSSSTPARATRPGGGPARI